MSKTRDQILSAAWKDDKTAEKFKRAYRKKYKADPILNEGIHPLFEDWLTRAKL